MCAGQITDLEVIMKRENDMFEAFMAYKYFMKDEEEAEERARQEERIEAEREQREYQLNKWKIH